MPHAHKSKIVLLNGIRRGLRIARHRQQQRHHPASFIRRGAFIVALTVVTVTAVVGCGWFGTSRSVRFNSSMTERQMSRLPPLFDEESAGDSFEDEVDYEAMQRAAEQWRSKIESIWQAARIATEGGDLPEARRRLQEFLRETSSPDGARWISGNDAALLQQKRRNSALDRLDALDSGAKPSAVRSYFATRDAYDAESTNAPANVNGVATDNAVTNRPAADHTAPNNAATDNTVTDDTDNVAANQIRSDDADSSSDVDSSSSADLASLISLALGADGAQHLNEAEADPRLRDNCAYLRAAVLYRRGDLDEARKTFARIASNRASRKRAASLFMHGLVSLKISRSYVGDGASAGGAGVCPDCQDEAWTQAHDSFVTLLRDYAASAFAQEARGWLGFLYLRVGKMPEGLAEYYRQLAAGDYATRRAALISLRLSRPKATPADIKRLQETLTGEPQVALTYIYHSLYNWTFSSWLFPYDAEDDYLRTTYGAGLADSDDYNRRQRYVALHRAELERDAIKSLTDFARELWRRYPRTQFAGGTALRLAELGLETDDNTAALDFATRALALRLNADMRAEALWTKGVAGHRLQKFDDARRTLAQLIREYPQHRLTEDARRHLAMVAEDAGDLNAALEQYLALDYTQDAAYFVDVLMTTVYLADFIEKHPAHERINDLWYSLGVRHLRAGDWDAARAAYAHVRTIQDQSSDTTDYSPYNDNASDADHDNDNRLPSYSKEPDYEDPMKGVRAAWVLRDLKTIEDISRLESAINTDTYWESKAEAMYQLASYFYQADSLMFYNPAMWRGTRYGALQFSHTDASYRVAGETEIYSTYLREHSTRARALTLYLQIAHDYPQTRAARDALYTAAVCYERLDYSWGNSAWGDVYDERFATGERGITYADVRRAYPTYQLPRGTLGWEPATRTVGGGNGWAAAPKPAPRPTRYQRVERKLSVFYGRGKTFVGDVWLAYPRPALVKLYLVLLLLYRWLLLVLTFAATLFMWRAVRWSRRLGDYRPVREPLREWLAHATRHVRRRRRYIRLVERARETDCLLVKYALPSKDAKLWFVAQARFTARRARPLSTRLSRHAYATLADCRARRLLLLNIVTHTTLLLLCISLAQRLW